MGDTCFLLTPTVVRGYRIATIKIYDDVDFLEAYVNEKPVVIWSANHTYLEDNSKASDFFASTIDIEIHVQRGSVLVCSRRIIKKRNPQKNMLKLLLFDWLYWYNANAFSDLLSPVKREA